MSEVNTPRLMAAAKEFNIGSQTLIDFLVSKSFSADDLKPSSKLTEDMYRTLQSEFQSDKAAKQKAEAIDLPKGASAEAKKKKDEEEAQRKKDSEYDFEHEDYEMQDVPADSPEQKVQAMQSKAKGEQPGKPDETLKRIAAVMKALGMERSIKR